MSRQRNPIFQRHRCPRCPRFSDLNFPCEIIQSEQAKGIGQGHVLQCQQGESWALRDESIWNAPSRVRVYGSRCMDLLSTRLTLQRSTPSFSSTAVPARFTLIQSTKYTLKKKGLKDASPGTSGQSRNEIHHKPTMHVYTQYPGSQAIAKSNI